jgi:hypothetical protein
VLILEGLRMENAGIFYRNLEYFAVIWYIWWPFGNVVVIWYIFLCFGLLCQEKSGSPATSQPTRPSQVCLSRNRNVFQPSSITRETKKFQKMCLSLKNTDLLIRNWSFVFGHFLCLEETGQS